MVIVLADKILIHLNIIYNAASYVSPVILALYCSIINHSYACEVVEVLLKMLRLLGIT